MKKALFEKNSIYLVLLTLAGVLFSGYLSFFKFFTGGCALGETCPLFFDIPACYFGFLMYAVMFAAALMLKYKKNYDAKQLVNVIFTISILGILFAGYFTVIEFLYPQCLGGCNYALLLPTCSWGLLMYIAILAISRKMR